MEPLHVRQSAERACGDRHDRRKRIITNGYCTRNEVRFTSFTLRHRDLHFSFANTRVSRFHHHHSCHTWKPHHLAPLIELPQVGADYGAPRHVSPEDPSRMQRKKSPAPPMDNDMLDCGLTSIDRSTLRDRSTDPKFCWDVEKQGRQPSHLGGFSVVQMTSAGNGDIRTSDMTNPAAHHPICAAASASFTSTDTDGQGTWMGGHRVGTVQCKPPWWQALVCANTLRKMFTRDGLPAIGN